MNKSDKSGSLNGVQVDMAFDFIKQTLTDVWASIVGIQQIQINIP